MDNWTQWLPAFVMSVIGFLGGLSTNRALSKKTYADIDIIRTDTYIRLSDRIDKLEERDQQKEKRIDWLEAELKRYISAYTLAIRFIHDKMPLVDIPNFLETDPRLKSK